MEAVAEAVAALVLRLAICRSQSFADVLVLDQALSEGALRTLCAQAFPAATYKAIPSLKVLCCDKLGVSRDHSQ
jgi:hypothetical protein